MPVIDLKDYLGMPQQAPTQPVFQSTTQSLDPMALRAYDPYSNEAMLANVEGRQRLAGLQRLAPAIQAQQAQLAYDKIGEEARVLRQKQEVEAQVQRATDELLGGALNPESTDFNQQATQFYGRNQLAFLDPRMREAMSFLQKQNQDYTTRQNALQRAEMKTAQQMFKAQQDEINRIDELRIDAIDSGAPRELVLAAKSPYEIASLKAQYGGRTEKDIRGQMMEKDLGLLASEMKRLEDLGEDAVTDETGKTTYTPRYQSLMDEATKLQGELRGFYQSKYRTPSVPTAPTAGVGDTTKTTTTPPPPTPPSPPTSNMGGLSPETIARLRNLPANELEAAIKQEQENLQKTLKANAEINQAWTKAKTDLEKKLKDILPDKPNQIGINPLEQFAKQVVSGVQAKGRTQTPQSFSVSQFGQTGPVSISVPVWQNVLEDIGINPFDKAFTEPGGKRSGAQDVNYAELIKDWARRFLEERESSSKEKVNTQQNQVAPPTANANIARMPKIQIGTPIQTPR
jgi:hypothetical protein